MALDRARLLHRADELARVGQVADARDCLLALVAEAPDDWSVVQAAAELCRRTGRPGDAARLLLGLARHVAHEGMADRARQLYEDVRQLLPGDRTATFRLAELASEAGDHEQARRWLAEAVPGAGGGAGPSAAGAVPGAPILNDLAAGRFDDARVALARLVARSRGVDPAITQAWLEAAAREPHGVAGLAVALADVCLVAGDPAAAVRTLREYLSRAPGEPDVLRHLVSMALAAGGGATVLEAQAELADALVACGRLEEALPVAEDLALRLPDAPNRARLERIRRAMDGDRTGGASPMTREVRVTTTAAENMLRDLTDALEALGNS